MPKIKSGFYAVRVGHEPGVYQSWEECEKQVMKHPKARYKKFATLQEAEAFVGEESNKREFFLGNSTQEISSLHNSKQLKLNSSISSSSVHLTAPNISNEGRLLVWTDGSSRNNGNCNARAGVGVYWGEKDPRNVSERLPGFKQTNIRAEIMAVIRAIEICPDSNVPLEIRTDSEFTIKAYTNWIPKWEKNKWKTKKGKHVENIGLFKRLMKLVRARDGEVIIKYVPGHVGVKENEEADRLANLGAMMNAVDDPYDYGEDDDEKSTIIKKTSSYETIPSINENCQTPDFKSFESLLTEDDFFSDKDKLEMENELGVNFVS